MGELTHLSLFSGIGGLDLAAEWAGFKTVGQCEWADYPTKVLEKHWPDVERWRDIRKLTKESFYVRTGLHTVDIISGGFPCQPFSYAGKQRSKEDDRYLWPEMARVIAELRPTWVIGENVAGIIKLALDDVLFDLEGKGYATRTFLIPACSVGAPHQRYRTAIVANTSIEGVGKLSIQPGQSRQTSANIIRGGENVANTESDIAGRLPSGKKAEESRFNIGGKDVEHSNGAGCKEQYASVIADNKGFVGGGCVTENVPDTNNGKYVRRQPHPGQTVRPSFGGTHNAGGEAEHGSWKWWAVEPGLGRVANGIPHRVDRLRCLGNAVVPQQFYPIFQAIADIEHDN